MIHYLDTSALLKRLVDERGTAEVRALFTTDANVATSRIAYVEAIAALARRTREGSLSPRMLKKLRDRVDADFEALRVIEVTAEILSKGADLCEDLPLRAYDAVHLSSAIRLKEEVDPEIRFVCADRTLVRLAETVGLDCWVPGS